MRGLRSSWFFVPVLLCASYACSSVGDRPPPAQIGALKDGGSDAAGDSSVVVPPGDAGIEPDASKNDPPVFGGFDPAQMYLAGTLQEGAGGLDVVADVRFGDTFAAGFETFGPRAAKIHPTDGFVYIAEDLTVRKFVIDPSPNRDSTGKYWQNYPKNTKANDPLIPMPPCDTNVGQFFVRPGTGAYFHTCRDSLQALRDSAGTSVATCNTFLSVGYTGAILCSNQVFDAAGAAHPLDVAVSDKAVAYRGKADGTFHVVTVEGQGTGATYTLWNVTETGTATKVYDYAKLAGFTPINADVRGWIELDGQGLLHRWGAMSATITADLIVKFDDKTGTVVYNETKVWTKFHGSNMVTGP